MNREHRPAAPLPRFGAQRVRRRASNPGARASYASLLDVTLVRQSGLSKNRFSLPARAGIASACLASTLWLGAGPLAGQGAIDPNVAPAAAALERGGDWIGATEMLGRYLATAPGDGRAWFQFGRMYLLAARDWHSTGHTGTPDGATYLDLAALAFDNAINLQIDSGRVYRGAVEMERDIIRLERHGWGAMSNVAGRGPTTVPGFVVELGANLVSSCPGSSVIVPGSQLESLAAWLASVELGIRPDVFPLLPDRFQADSLYRQRMASQLRLVDTPDAHAGSSAAAAGHTLCLTPFADTVVVGVQWSVTRLALVSGPAPVTTNDALTITQLQRSRNRPNGWTEAVTSVYLRAASRNVRLCGGLLSYLDDPAVAACGR